VAFRIEENTNPKAGVTIDPDGWVNIRPEKKWSGISFIVVNASDGQYGARSSFTVTVIVSESVREPSLTTTSNV
jgi:hypothetical protein